MATPTDRFTSISIEYPPDYTGEHYASSAEELFGPYLMSIVDTQALTERLDSDFWHIDGVISLDEEPPKVQHISATPGLDNFVGFRTMVNAQEKPAGPLQGVYISPEDYAPIAAQVNRQLPPEVRNLGSLIGAAAMCFPYVLRPESEGGEPLDLPPFFYGLLQSGEEPFVPLHAEGQHDRDFNSVNVIQAVYANLETGLITARVGLVWDDARAVPFAVHAQIVARRAGRPLQPATPAEVARRLHEAANR